MLLNIKNLQVEDKKEIINSLIKSTIKISNLEYINFIIIAYKNCNIKLIIYINNRQQQNKMNFLVKKLCSPNQILGKLKTHQMFILNLMEIQKLEVKKTEIIIGEILIKMNKDLVKLNNQYLTKYNIV